MGASAPSDRSRLVEDLYDLACFLLTAARQLPREPRHYGPLRLATAAERIAALAPAHGLEAPHLTAIAEALVTSRPKALTDPDGFLEALDEVILNCAHRELEGLDEPPATPNEPA